LDLSLFF